MFLFLSSVAGLRGPRDGAPAPFVVGSVVPGGGAGKGAYDAFLPSSTLR